MTTAAEGDPPHPPSSLLAPLLDLSLGTATAAEGDPPFSLLLRLLDLPLLLQAEAGAFSLCPHVRLTCDAERVRDHERDTYDVARGRDASACMRKHKVFALHPVHLKRAFATGALKAPCPRTLKQGAYVELKRERV
jgi:hypothetical protein